MPTETLYEAAQAAKNAWDEHGTKTSVYTLYDSDKSGRSAAQNVEEKLLTYSDGAPITVRNLAVTPEQIEEWDLPTREAKKPGRGAGCRVGRDRST